MPDNPAPRRRWFQVNLREIAVAVGLFALAFAAWRGLQQFDEMNLELWSLRVPMIVAVYVAPCAAIGTLFKQAWLGVLVGLTIFAADFILSSLFLYGAV